MIESLKVSVTTLTSRAIFLRSSNTFSSKKPSEIEISSFSSTNATYSKKKSRKESKWRTISRRLSKAIPSMSKMFRWFLLVLSSANNINSEFLPRLVLCHCTVQIRNSRRAGKLSRWSGSLPSFYSCNRYWEYKEGFRSRQRYGARVLNIHDVSIQEANSLVDQNNWTPISSQRKHGPADARIKSTLTEIISTCRHKHKFNLYILNIFILIPLSKKKNQQINFEITWHQTSCLITSSASDSSFQFSNSTLTRHFYTLCNTRITSILPRINSSNLCYY